jgi:hypothetical protein
MRNHLRGEGYSPSIMLETKEGFKIVFPFTKYFTFNNIHRTSFVYLYVKHQDKLDVLGTTKELANYARIRSHGL